MADEKKKPEVNEEGPERVGPYLIEEQVQQSHDSQEGLYLARYETNGATALLRKLAAEESAAPGKSWRVLLEFWASRGYSALRVEHTDWARDLDRQSAESLLHTLEAVLEEVRRMLHAASGTHEPRPRWHLGLGVASAVAGCALLSALVLLASVAQRRSGPEPVASTPPAPLSHEVPAALTSGTLGDTTPQEPSGLARPLPKEPFKGQKRPPCTRYAEVELIGACWTPHKLTAPCPDVLYEHQGECYVPTFSAKPPPSSLGQ